MHCVVYLILMMHLCYLYHPTSFGGRSYATTNDLPGDVFGQILVRLPPHPSCILRASVAQKCWMDFMGSNDFKRLTLPHNRGMSLLGFFTNSSEDARFLTDHNLDQSIFQKLNRLVEVHKAYKPYVLGCRNGRVLLHYPQGSNMIKAWDPISGSETVIPEPPIWRRREYDSGTILYSRNHGKLSSHCCSNF